MNAVEIEQAVSDLTVKPFDAKEFPFAFLEAFGNKDATIKRLRAMGKASTNASDIEAGVLQRNKIYVAVAPADKVDATLKALRDSPATRKAKAQFILATDGDTLQAEELATGDVLACDFSELGDRFSFFLALAGISTVREIKNNPIDIKATARLNKLYVELLRENPEWGTPEKRQTLNQFMARLIFCFFAEDTGIFQDDLFTTTVGQFSQADQTGSNVHDIIRECFRAMALESAQRRAQGGDSEAGELGGRFSIRQWRAVHRRSGMPEVFPHRARLFAAGGRFEMDRNQPRHFRLDDSGGGG